MSHTPALDPESVRRLLDGHDFVALFREHLGWDRHDHTLDVPVETHTFRLSAVAEKRNFAVYLCSPDTRGRVPDRAARDAIERVLAKTAHEHLIIFADKDRRHQVWMWIRRVPGKPASQQSYEWFKGQPTGQILQRVLPTLAIAFEDDDATTLPDVRARVAAAFDVEKVTKKFFERFQKEHAAFHKFIEGIKVAADRDWYASVMLNRLMFCYFIQKKGLLDGDTDYLRNRLARLQSTKGKDKFWTFYQHFLLRLFHEGLSTKPGQRSKDLDALIGRIPYLNGGLFDIHEIEERYDDIQIPDTAFEKLFKFFDEYRWHLDERPLRENNEINPDVLGYIFEKYINQKQMGAYYTKEDITGYISQNTIIPYILDQAAAACTIAFVPPGAPNSGGSVWRLLQSEPDRYIYEPVRRGVIDDGGNVIPLPSEVEAGITDVSKRGGWNKPAATPFGLPTETWREHNARRERCLEMRRKLAGGEVSTVNDLVTLNLDIRQFAADMIERCEGPDLLRAMWKAVESVTVLDPTCGSGAFLFAALNVLEPLYEACLDRMGGFLDTLARDAAAAAEGKGRSPAPDTFADFRRILDRVADHPNRRYFILKSIIVNNLYGVDIMEEACEICKLRLFLKMVAQVEEGAIEKIEPLPDIDFNIRAGNTLVGFTSMAAIEKAAPTFLANVGFVDSIRTRAQEAAAEFAAFRAMQTAKASDHKPLMEAKKRVRAALGSLHEELDRYLASEYEIDPEKPRVFASWRATHQPFHWLVDFYAIMASGGFNVIVGNPPYVEYRKVRSTYGVLQNEYRSMECKNLYGLCMERSATLLAHRGYFGMIVPSGVLGLDDAKGLRRVMLDRYGTNWLSTYAIRPSKLFEGVDQRLCITLCGPRDSSVPAIWTSKYHHWNSDEREHLFATLRYARSRVWESLDRIVQIGDAVASEIVDHLEALKSQTASSYYAGSGLPTIGHYHRSPRYWIRAMDFEPAFRSATRDRSVHHFRDLEFRDVPSAKAVCAIMNSNLYFFWFLAIGNGRNLTGSDVDQFPVGQLLPHPGRKLGEVFDRLMRDYKKHSVMRERADCTYQEFRPSLSKPVIDEIDIAMREHYRLSEICLDYLLNFEIKYRLGDTEEAEEGDE